MTSSDWTATGTCVLAAIALLGGIVWFLRLLCSAYVSEKLTGPTNNMAKLLQNANTMTVIAAVTYGVMEVAHSFVAKFSEKEKTESAGENR
jgi:hypothetical protein